MKLETILDAMVIAIQDYYKIKYDISFLDKRLRQARAFRNRILDTVGRMEEHIRFQDDVIDSQKQRIAELEAYFIGASTSTNKEE